MSGLPTDKFTFFGFVPKKLSDQEICFEIIKNDNKTSIFFESPKRLEKTITNLIKVIGKTRRVSICKEMTKLHEQIFRGSISEILEDIKKDKILLKGEIVIVVEGAQKNNINNYILDKNTKKEFLKKLSASDAAKLISLITGQNKRDVYKNLIEI